MFTRRKCEKNHVATVSRLCRDRVATVSRLYFDDGITTPWCEHARNACTWEGGGPKPLWAPALGWAAGWKCLLRGFGPLTAFHSWHSIFCFPFPHLPFFPSLPFLSFHFLPVLPFPSCPFPCLSPSLLPCLPFSPVPSSCSLLSERTHQMGYSTWNSLCATLPPVCFRVAGIGTFIPHPPPEFNIEKGFRSEAP